LRGQKMQPIFQASQIAKLVGIPKTRLAKFVERPAYGVGPSLRQDSGKGIPRLYTADDLLEIALAWWLFQAGFRPKAIGVTVADSKKQLQNSQSWTNAADRFLVIRRGITKGANYAQKITVERGDHIATKISSDHYHATQILPVGALWQDMWGKVHKRQEN